MLVRPRSFSALLWPIAWEKQWPACENAPRGGHCFSDGCGLMSNDFPVSSAQMPRGEGLRSCSGAALTGGSVPAGSASSLVPPPVGSTSCWLRPSWPHPLALPPCWLRPTGSTSLLAPPLLPPPTDSASLLAPPYWPCLPVGPAPLDPARWLRLPLAPPHWLCLKGKSEGRLPGGRGPSALSCPHPF